jgi:hypothetical protein
VGTSPSAEALFTTGEEWFQKTGEALELGKRVLGAFRRIFMKKVGTLFHAYVNSGRGGLARFGLASTGETGAAVAMLHNPRQPIASRAAQHRACSPLRRARNNYPTAPAVAARFVSTRCTWRVSSRATRALGTTFGSLPRRSSRRKPEDRDHPELQKSRECGRERCGSR